MARNVPLSEGEPGASEVLWWVTVRDWNGVLVYDGPAPCPAELVTITPEMMLRGELYEFDMRAMGTA